MNKQQKVEALIAKHPFTGMGGRIIYEAPQALADEFQKMLAAAWDEGTAFSAAASGEEYSRSFRKDNPYRPAK